MYLILRAIYTPILHDEIATYYYYIQTGIYFPPDAHWDANNHILNSLLSNICFQIFGDDPWSLRLPNVLTFPLYYIFSWKLTKNIAHSGLKWSAFLALVMCHYLFEYFGETRGYGMSMAFMLMGIYSAMRYLKNRQMWWSFIAIFSLFLAVASNLTILYIYLMVLTLLCAGILTSNTKRTIQLIQLTGLLLFAGILIVPLIDFSLELKERGALYYGGKSSFIEYTLSTLADLILGSKNSVILVLIISLSMALFFLTIQQLAQNFRHIIHYSLEPQTTFSLLFFGSLTAIFATRYLLDVNFPEDRTALYLYPLFVLSLAQSTNYSKLPKQLAYLVVTVLLAYIPSNFIYKIDVNQASFSMEERAPQAFFDYVQKAGEKQHFKPTVGGYHTQNLCWYYMNAQAGGEQNTMLYSSFPDTLCDYQIRNIKVNTPSNFSANYELINENPVNKLNLYRRKKPLVRTLITKKGGITNWTHQNEEYFNMLEYNVEKKHKNKPLLLEMQGVLHAPNAPFYGKIIISQKDSTWHEISQEGFVFNWLRYDWRDDTKPFRQVLILPQLNQNARYIQVFVWNIQRKPYLIKQLNLSLYSLGSRKTR